ncbi:glycosyltransferase family 2 protein [Paenibacillus koleovorans]|uniref:glycosyltransferase family 2 protein n=1 Tax=Paenibacillus koleovorans TaxID=121608 RepID=UPI000FD74B53|nr:glycosyltransferase family 2 protein [Paenibacillus koleovorans]
MEKGKILIVVPAFNEQNNILKVIWDIREHVPEADILIVNDCSTDQTSSTARKAEGVKVVDLPYNLGIGGAVQTGFKYAYAQGYDYVVQIDGDGQHPPKEVDKLYGAMLRTGADMVIGSRFLDIKSFRTSWTRRLGIRVFYVLFRILIQTKVTDGTSGFRMYSRKGMELLSRHYSDDYPEPDAVIVLKKNGLKIHEIGVEMRHREHGKSSITPLKSLYYMAKVIVSIFFSYIRPRW